MSDPILRYAETLALLARLYRALDDSDPERLAACFTADAVWHRPDGAKTGTAAIRTVATDRPADRRTSHVPSNLVLEPAGDALVARYYLTVYGEVAGAAPRLLVCWDCEDRLATTPDGLRLTDKRTVLRMKFA